MNNLTFESVFLAILAAMVGQNRVLAPQYQKAVATNALEMAAAVMEAYEAYQDNLNPAQTSPVDERADERDQLAEALGLKTMAADSQEIEYPAARPSAQEMLDGTDKPATEASVDSDAS